MNNVDIFIYVDEVSKRLIYTLEVIGKARGLSFELTNDVDQFSNYKGCKLNYSHYPFQNKVPTLLPSDLLFEESIQHHKLEKSNWNKVPIFEINGVNDVLAAIFYTITCYEEYLNTERDIHGRSLIENNVLFRFGWHKQLMVERWSVAFLQFLEEENKCQLPINKIPWCGMPTFDIDNTYAYRLKVGPRKWLSIAKDLLLRNQDRLTQRKLVLKEMQQDPYDTFDKIKAIAKDGFEVKVFWLVGDYAQYDRNISIQDPHHQRLIRSMCKSVTVGLHPSYRSHKAEVFLKEEMENLKNVVGAPVQHARQHFLKLQIPVTYEHLLNVGITADYTMGFAEDIGFRAGISRPFYWFNLRTNNQTALQIHPFAYMDGTLLEYQGWTISQAKEKIAVLVEEVKSFGGTFSFIWHNETIGNYGKWKGWDEVLHFTLELLKPTKQTITNK